MRKSNQSEKIAHVSNNDYANKDVCPQCGATELRLSRLTSRHLLRRLFYNPYRCGVCHFSFWKLGWLRLGLGVIAGLVVIFMSVIFTLGYKHQDIASNHEDITIDDNLFKAAEQGDANAQLKLGLRYAFSPWNTKDEKLAAQWFEKAAGQGQFEAEYRYGFALLKGLGVVQDYKAAFFWLEKAAGSGYADAQFVLGEMYQLGLFVNSDNERAYLWFNLAAAQGVKGAASSRDLLVKQLSNSQITRLQAEAGVISRNEQAQAK